MAEPFVCIGAMKSGTTTLYELLRQHPQVDVVAEKESSDLLDSSTARRLAERISRSAAVVAGEVSTAYMQSPIHPQPVTRAAETLGKDVRVVAILRDPYGRAISHWQHWTQLGRETRPVDEALLDPDGAYRAFSSYYRQLLPWLDKFGEDRLHVIKLEDYQSAPAKTAQLLWDYLGVAARGEADDMEVHVNSAADRVVAVGIGRRLRAFRIYQLVRPLVPEGARRMVSTALGGAKNRQYAAPSDYLRSRFGELIAEDGNKLLARWPGLRWD
ncbi:sulfotransferase domain-containing protein [Microlunatus sp. Gsoil 973]|uniref:sulfotransferase domain-containing protein n=1 Tax=Microlunatus sp. Gsoil 973 TaxID=2672569 RepID=UPI0012B45F99|nr:sulfotransferase domain-containing protein [Microlunatus sp. Gsoil 973]QGN32793.1 hypothetical protein GJV80_08210 [Microlunatus sp. Gsoil 973]